MDRSKPVHNPIVLGLKLSEDEDGQKNDSTLYKKLVGSLMYLTVTRPDMMFLVSILSRYMGSPTEVHVRAAKRVFRYLRGTYGLGIFYKKGEKKELIAYTNSDYAGDLEVRKTTSGHVFIISSGVVSWSSRKQPVVTLPTTEAEFMAVASCACQAVWLRRILEKLGHTQIESTIVYCDNSSTTSFPRTR